MGKLEPLNKHTERILEQFVPIQKEKTIWQMLSDLMDEMALMDMKEKLKDEMRKEKRKFR